ncbi:hypothetical protein MY11210_008012 [Beauveria gryllotalpidicola]
MKFSLSALLVGLVASVHADGSVERIPDSEWDHILHGSDILSQRSAETAKTDGYLADYTMRSRIVDPSALKVDTVKQLSGYIDDDANDKHLFFWFFESRNNPAKDPVVLWLNGGPGCSSFIGLFNELGPATIPRSDLKPVRNDYSWNNNASVIFVEQPVNTGFSYSGNSVDTSVASAKDLYSLLTFFFKQYPQYATQDFHISGESYAGHYIPLTAAEILSHDNRNINLKSILVGNGMTEPLTQYDYYRPMACGEGGYNAVLSQSSCRAMDNALPECKRLIKSCYDTENASTCQSATNYCNRNVLSIYNLSGRDVYDIRKSSADETVEYSAQFLNSINTRKAIGAERMWEKCDNGVYGAFLNTGDWMKPIYRVFPGLLAKIPILIYAGDADYICNWLGNRAWAKALEWPGKDAFNQAPVQPLKLGGSGKEYGKVTHSGNFNFMQIYGAGHLVPSDQPVASLDFFNRWIWVVLHKLSIHGALNRYKYASSSILMFCETCGTPVFAQKIHEGETPDVFYLAAGLLPNLNVDLVKVAQHIWVGDTLDGGASVFMQNLNGPSQPIPRWQKGHGEADGLLDSDWPPQASCQKRTADDSSQKSVRVQCICKGVDLTLWRGNDDFRKLKAQGKLPGWVNPATLKPVAAYDACDSCRFMVGSIPIMHWTFARVAQLGFAARGQDDEPFPTNTLDLKAAVKAGKDGRFGTLTFYESSPDVQRYYCSRCSASVFYAVDELSDQIDVSMGLIHAPEGSRAESWVEWEWGGLGHKDNTVGGWREAFGKAIQAGSEEWRVAKGLPKGHRLQ